MPYRPYYTDRFKAQTKKIKNQEKFLARLNEIVVDPRSDALNAHPLTGDWVGFWSADYEEVKGRGVLRIIYRLCDECIDNRYCEYFPARCCKDDPVDMQKLRFYDFGNTHESAGRKRLTPRSEYPGDTPLETLGD